MAAQGLERSVAVTSVITDPCIDVKDRAYLEEEILRAYPPAKVALFPEVPHRQP